eukprot:scaffold50455_cov68-Phaeocystis_antarctica.AAC.1
MVSPAAGHSSHTELTYRPRVPLDTVAAAADAGFFAAAARREPGLVILGTLVQPPPALVEFDRLEGHVGTALSVFQAWQALDGGVALLLGKQVVVALAAITAAASFRTPRIVGTRHARELVAKVRGLPHSPCRARLWGDRSLGAVKAKWASAALAVIGKPQQVTPRALEALQLPCRSAAAYLASAAYLAIGLALFVLFSLSGVGACVPAPHGSTFAVPFGQRDPLGQISHSSALSRSGRVPTLPGGHWSVAGLPTGQNLPFSQAMGTTVPAPQEYPAGHLREHAGFDCLLVSFESPTIPAEHAKGKSPRCSPGSKR